MFTKKSRKCSAPLLSLCNHHDLGRGEAGIINSLVMHIIPPTCMSSPGV